MKKKNRKKPWHCCFFHFTSCSWWRAHLARSRDSRRALDKNDLNVSSSLQTCLVAFCLQSTSNLAWLLRPAPEHSENQAVNEVVKDLLQSVASPAQHGMAQHGTAWHSLAWQGLARWARALLAEPACLLLASPCSSPTMVLTSPVPTKLIKFHEMTS